MKKLLIISIFILIVSMSFAQKDIKAEKILSKVSQTYKAYNSFRIKFSLTVENKEENIKDSSIGTADIKNDKYKVTIMGAETYFDGKTRCTYLKDSEEVNITEPEDNNNEISNPAKMFDIYKKGFNYKLIKQYKEGNVNIASIELIPIKKREFLKIILNIDLDKSQIISFVSYGMDGNNLILKMSGFESNHEFADKHFVFDKKAHPNAEVIDMR